MSKDNSHNIKTIRACEEELDLEFEDDYWSRVLDNVLTTISCARLSIIQFKTIHRADKCKLSPYNVNHMFVFCPKLKNFWNSYLKIISDVLGIKLVACPLIEVLSIPSQCQPLSRRQANAMAFASLLIRRRILLSWPSSQPPISVWLKDLAFC